MLPAQIHGNLVNTKTTLKLEQEKEPLFFLFGQQSSGIMNEYEGKRMVTTFLIQVAFKFNKNISTIFDLGHYECVRELKDGK